MNQKFGKKYYSSYGPGPPYLSTYSMTRSTVLEWQDTVPVSPFVVPWRVGSTPPTPTLRTVSRSSTVCHLERYSLTTIYLLPSNPLHSGRKKKKRKSVCLCFVLGWPILILTLITLLIKRKMVPYQVGVIIYPKILLFLYFSLKKWESNNSKEELPSTVTFYYCLLCHYLLSETD